MGLSYDPEIGGWKQKLMQFCCKLKGIMILSQILPPKQWSVLDIIVCNGYKTLEALLWSAIKREPENRRMWAESVHCLYVQMDWKIQSQPFISISTAEENRPAWRIKQFCKRPHSCTRTYHSSEKKNQYIVSFKSLKAKDRRHFPVLSGYEARIPV